MSWLRIDDKFAQHPKVLGLSDREFRVHVLALCYCAEYGTDGTIPTSSWRTLGVTQRIADRLVSVGLWDKEKDAYKAHDFRKYNPKDPTSALRKERYRERHGNAEGTDEERSEEREGNAPGTFLTRAHPVPTPTQPQEQEGSNVTPKDVTSTSYEASYEATALELEQAHEASRYVERDDDGQPITIREMQTLGGNP